MIEILVLLVLMSVVPVSLSWFYYKKSIAKQSQTEENWVHNGTVFRNFQKKGANDVYEC